MDKIASEVRKELLHALSAAYRQTELSVPIRTMEYIKDHDEAVLYIARKLGFTDQEVYRAADIDRGR